MRSFCIARIILLMMVLGCGLTLGQDRTRGVIAGAVEDNAGAVVTNVKVTLSGAFGTQSMATDDRGTFTFSNLTPGQFSVKAELAGFKTTEATNVRVRVGEQSYVKLMLLR